MPKRVRTATPLLVSGDRSADRALLPTIQREAGAPGAPADPVDSARTLPRPPLAVVPPSASSPPPPDDFVNRLNAVQALGLGDLAQGVDAQVRHLLESDDPPTPAQRAALLEAVCQVGATVKKLLEVMRVGSVG